MNLEEAREELSSYKNLKKKIYHLQLKEQELRRLAGSANSINYLRIGDSPSSVQQSQQERFIKLALEKSEEWHKLYEKAEEIALQLESRIYGIAADNVVYGNILSYRFINCLKIKTVCDLMHYSMRRVFDLLDEAVEKYSEKWQVPLKKEELK